MTPPCSASLVLDVLEALSRSGIHWAALTNEAALARGDAPSDIDIIVARPVAEVARAVTSELGAERLAISFWRYDAHAAALFVTVPSGGVRAQLDMVHDPRGHGKYGFRSGVLLADHAEGSRWPRVSDADSALYQVRKRVVKGEVTRLVEAVRSARCAGIRHHDPRIDEVFERRAAASVRAALAGSPPHATRGRPWQHRLVSIPRQLERIRNPAGFWVHLAGGQRWDPASVRPQLEPLLPVVRLVAQPRRRSALPLWWATAVAPARWRAGLVVSAGPGGAAGLPDLVLDGDLAPEAVVTTALQAMADRVRRRLAVQGTGASGGRGA